MTAERGARRGGVWALVPAKSFRRAKSRLADRLDERARAKLARDMLEHVLEALSRSPSIAGILVVTDGDEVAEVALAAGAQVARDAREPPLGAIVDAALDELHARGAEEALVVMSDLPELATRDVDELLDRMRDADLVAAPDLKQEGTNALGVRPPGRVRTAFGTRDSFARHLRLAEDAGLRVAVHRSQGLGFDVDDVDDLARLANATRSS